MLIRNRSIRRLENCSTEALGMTKLLNTYTIRETSHMLSVLATGDTAECTFAENWSCTLDQVPDVPLGQRRGASRWNLTMCLLSSLVCRHWPCSASVSSVPHFIRSTFVWSRSTQPYRLGVRCIATSAGMFHSSSHRL